MGREFLLGDDENVLKLIMRIAVQLWKCRKNH